MTGAVVELRSSVGDLDVEARLEIAAGEVVAILGPNGAGKSTLLRAVAGLHPLEEGRVVVGERVWEDVAAGIWLPPADRRAGLVFQDYALFPHLNAVENVAFGLEAAGQRRREARDVARGHLREVDLEQVADRRPSSLSGGERARVALARALATEPALLLLDEPLAATDTQARAGLRRLLRAEVDRLGVPVLLVTHDPLEAAALSSRVVIFEGGHQVQVGTPADITRHPRSAYVADLAGINLVEGECRDGEIRTVAGGLLRVPREAPEGRVFAAIHPHAVALYDSPPGGSPRNSFAGTVGSVEPLRDRVRVEVAADVSLVAEVTPEAVAGLRLAPGVPVTAVVKATEITVYPN